MEMSRVLLHLLLDPSMKIARMHTAHSLAVTSTERRSRLHLGLVSFPVVLVNKAEDVGQEHVSA